ncbi:MAG: tyrosinase family protein [Nitrososphaeraceae archaeon]
MTVVRRNILSNSTVRDQYIEGVKLLKNDFLRPNWPNTYDIFVIWHFYSMMTQTPPNSGSGRNAAHRGPSFLPWHRWMLILLEHHLQRVLNDPNFGLPYWNWEADGELTPSQQRNAAIWANNCMGGSGSPVTSGPFREGQWQVDIEQGFAPGSIDPTLVSVRRPLRRALGSGFPRRLPTKKEVREAVRSGAPNVIYDSPPWDINSVGFRNELEGWTNGPRNHNRVHVWVGGDMGPATSPNDPVFYLNHCNVDRIWSGWQQIFQNPRYVPNSSASAALRRHRLNDLLFPVTESATFDPIYQGRVRPSNLLDISSRYTYDTFTDLE